GLLGGGLGRELGEHRFLRERRAARRHGGGSDEARGVTRLPAGVPLPRAVWPSAAGATPAAAAAGLRADGSRLSRGTYRAPLPEPGRAQCMKRLSSPITAAGQLRTGARVGE